MENNFCTEVIQKWKLLDLSRIGLVKKCQFSDESDENSSLSLNVLNPESSSYAYSSGLELSPDVFLSEAELMNNLREGTFSTLMLSSAQG